MSRAEALMSSSRSFASAFSLPAISTGAVLSTLPRSSRSAAISGVISVTLPPMPVRFAE